MLTLNKSHAIIFPDKNINVNVELDIGLRYMKDAQAAVMTAMRLFGACIRVTAADFHRICEAQPVLLNYLIELSGNCQN